MSFEELENDFAKESGILDNEEHIVEALEKVILARRDLERKLEEEIRMHGAPQDVESDKEKDLFLERKEIELREKLAKIGSQDDTETRKMMKDMKNKH